MQLSANALANDWCWYAADEGDAAGVVLARGLGDALRRRLPELEELAIPTATSVDETAAAELLARAIEEGLSDDVVLVVDDVHELGPAASSGARLLEALVRFAPPELHLVFASRDEVPFSIARLRAQGSVLDLDAADLSFAPGEVDAAVVAALGEEASSLAASLYEVTSGWPVAVQLALEWLASVTPAERTGALDALATRRTPLMAYLADEIFGSEPPYVRELLGAIVQFDRVTPSLCAACGLTDADGVLDDLARRGLLSETDGSYAPHALIRQFVAAAWPLPADAVRTLRRRAGEWYEANYDPIAAARAFTAARDREGVRRVFDESWAVLDNAAAVDVILEGAALLSPSERTRPALIAHALIVRGEIDEARRWIAEAREQDPVFGFLEGLAHMHRSEHREAVDKFLRAREGYGGADYYCTAFAAYELLALGRIEEARRLAGEAEVFAKDSYGGEAEAQLLASDLAFCDGDFASALTAAQAGCRGFAETSNVLGECSAWNHLAYSASLLGKFAEAVAAADAATRLSERIGVSHFQAWTAATRGFVSLQRGAFDEALQDFAAAVNVHERLGSSGASEALVGLGYAHGELGERVQARGVYERGLALAERTGNNAAQVVANAGLARLATEEDPAEALALAERAVELAATVPYRFEATLARGWVLHDIGDTQAAVCAAEAEAIARRTASPVLLARAIELRAATAAAAEQREGLLREALGLWRRLGNEHAAAAVGASLARRAAAAPLAVETLARFAVLRNGEVVTPAEWQSKKARDLLKILVTRRGQATPRDYVIELLWPEDDPARTPKRLAVAVNVLRNVLDPERAHGTDHFVAGETEGLRLELQHVRVDVEDFLRQAGEALSSDDRALLEVAEAAYTGDFLPEDVYVDWATPLREEVRAAYLEVVRALASTTGDVRYLVRLLALDPYDEDSHLLLIRTYARGGKHGEARRAYRRYVDCMRELGLEPTAYEHVTKQP